MLKLEVPSSGLRLGTKSKFCDLKLSFSSHSVNVLVGPNGGGKTTLLRAILSPREAGISLFYEEQNLCIATALKRSSLISYVGTTSGHRPNIEVEDFLSFSFYKKGQLDVRYKIEKILEQLGISNLINSRIDQLSEGEYKRVHIASGLLQDAKWYLLDEPEEHLDPGALKSLAKTISGMKAEGKSFILACHNLNFASYLADNFIGINTGGELNFNESKKTCIDGRLLEKLFLCDFLYSTARSEDSSTNLHLTGLQYE